MNESFTNDTSLWHDSHYELLSRGFGRFRLHTSLQLRVLIRSWRGVYVCKSRCTRTRFQFKKTLPGEHSSEHFCCVGTHVQAFMNLVEVFFLRCFSEACKKHFRRNFRKCSRMRPNNLTDWLTRQNILKLHHITIKPKHILIVFNSHTNNNTNHTLTEPTL